MIGGGGGGGSTGDRLCNHQKVDPLDRKKWGAYLCTWGTRGRDGSQQWFQNFVYWKSDSPLPYVIYGIIYEDRDYSLAARLFFLHHPCCWALWARVSIVGISSISRRYIQYLTCDLRKISVLSRCSLCLINSKTWTFTSILVFKWWAKCLPTRVKGFANTDGGAFCGSVACLMSLKCS